MGNMCDEFWLSTTYLRRRASLPASYPGQISRGDEEKIRHLAFRAAKFNKENFNGFKNILEYKSILNLIKPVKLTQT